ncbi:MAG TPA: magnesium transporter CorA family protein [bacterium]|nr:magnesium transporter CorA family protein [bacterium]HPN42701.1 magnesium transporter CorA family protein [bacterium]
MYKKFNIVDRTIVLTDKEDNVIDFYINPDDKEKQNILKNLDFDEHTLSSSLDADEISRVEFEKDYTFILWKRPNNYSSINDLHFKVSSIGIILSRKKIILILTEDYELYNKREFNKVISLNDYFLKILFFTIRHYVDHIKTINMMSKELQDKINMSLENKYLIQMFSLSESLVYYINAISANSTVLIKLHNNAQKIGFTQDEIEILEDLIIENNQCSKQAEIYSTILSGLMDARGNLVNNNMNVLLKKLTIINVIFLPLNLIASIGGMSEYSALTKHIPWEISYSLFGLAMIIVGWLTAMIINRINYGRKITIWKGFKVK